MYTFSQDGASAYTSGDGLVLARVPKARIRDREAYEFFAALDGAGRPQWTRDIEARSPVFRFPGHCQRVDAVYNPRLKRYLLALGYNHKGGWGIFDSVELVGALDDRVSYRLLGAWRDAWLPAAGEMDRPGGEYR